MTKHLLLILAATVLLVASSPAADVEFSTTGVMDTPATHGGDRDFWGTEFITRWDNTTGADVILDELAWPCGGWWAQFWYVWITDTRPVNPYTLEYYDSFVATSEDDTEWPPSLYTYIDVSDKDIVVPVGASMYFGYSNPGMAGQILFNGVETFSWLGEAWDMDGDFGRTAVMQFKGTFAATPVGDEVPGAAVSLGNHPNPFNPSTTLTFSLPRDMAVDLTVYSVQGRPVRRLLSAEREAGTHRVVWDGTDQLGHTVPSGIYLARISTEDGIVSHKVVVAK